MSGETGSFAGGSMMSSSFAPAQALPARIQSGGTAIAAILAATVLVVLDAMIANIALPSISASLRIAPGWSVAVVTAYQLALVMALLPCAALGESLGYRRVFIGGVALFVAASAACALAPSLPWLITARFVQGLGGAAIMALGVALLRFVVPNEHIGAAIGWNALAVALASAAGPTIGAAILSIADWHWLFAVNLPLGALILAAGKALPVAEGDGRRIDLASAALNAAAFAALVIGADTLPHFPGAGVALLGMAGAAAAALVRRERSRTAPLIPLDLLRVRSFRISVIASVCCFVGQTAALVALPFYLRHGLGQSAMMTGLYLTPWPLAAAVSAPLAGRLSARFSTGWLCAAGGLSLAIGLAGAAALPTHASPILLAAATLPCGFGFGLFQVPNNRNMFLSAPRERSGAAGGMQGTARLTGQTLGALLVGLLLVGAPLATASRLGLMVAAVLALTAGLISLLRVE